MRGEFLSKERRFTNRRLCWGAVWKAPLLGQRSRHIHGPPCAGFTILGRGCARGGDEWAAFKGGHRRERDIGHVAGQTFQRKFLPEREVRIAIPHQNPTQIWMASEAKTHHVVDFTFVPVGG